MEALQGLYKYFCDVLSAACGGRIRAAGGGAAVLQCCSAGSGHWSQLTPLFGEHDSVVAVAPHPQLGPAQVVRAAGESEVVDGVIVHLDGAGNCVTVSVNVETITGTVCGLAPCHHQTP